jgi:hypothetical protein
MITKSRLKAYYQLKEKISKNGLESLTENELESYWDLEYEIKSSCVDIEKEQTYINIKEIRNV